MMKRIFALFACILVLMSAAGALAETDHTKLVQLMFEMFQELAQGETTEQIPIYEEWENPVQVIYFDGQEELDTLLGDLAWIEFMYPYTYSWNSYDAGERALYAFSMLSSLARTRRDNNIGATPLDVDKMDALTNKLNGAFSIQGFDSAYLYGEGVNADGKNYQWELLPFYIVDENNQPFEMRAYAFFRAVFPEDGSNLEYVYYAVDKEDIVSIYRYLVNNCSGLNEFDHAVMSHFVELYESQVDDVSAPEDSSSAVISQESAESDFDVGFLLEISDSVFIDELIETTTHDLGGGIELKVHAAKDQAFDTLLDDSAWEMTVADEQPQGQEICADRIIPTVQNAIEISRRYMETYPKFLADYPRNVKVNSAGALIRIFRDTYMSGRNMMDAFGDTLQCDAMFFAIEEGDADVMIDDTLYLYLGTQKKTADGYQYVDHIIADQREVYQAVSHFLAMPSTASSDTVTRLQKWMFRHEDLATDQAASDDKPMATAKPTAAPTAVPTAPSASDYETKDLGNGTCEITGYTGTATELTIPSEIGGKRVVSIGEDAFLYDDALKNVVIPDSVTSIGYRAFMYCDGLVNVTIPDSVTSIGGYAFYYCSSLSNVTISDRVMSIGEYAFSGCESLTDVPIPDSVTSIGENAFAFCISLANVTIPDSVTSIGDGAFEGCSSLMNITIPDSVTSIEGSVFYGCSSLTNVTIPDSVTSIGANAFYGCSSLTNVTIPDSVTSIGFSAFYGCSGLINVMIPDNVTNIENYAFFRCSSLTTVTIPDSVTSIGRHAFIECTSLKKIYGKPGSVAERLAAQLGVEFVPTGNAAESQLTAAYASDYETKDLGNGTCEITGYTGTATELTIPSEIGGKRVVSIGRDAFSNNSRLKSVVIPDGVTSIGDSAFSHCSSLTGINIPDSVTSIETFAFSGCESLTEISLPNSVSCISVSAFTGCKSLTGINIPDSVTFIDEGAFSGCESLTKISIPDSVTFIGSWTFSGCISLTEINIPDGVTSIGVEAFSGCESLTEISIPDSVTRIGDNAFAGCIGLTNVTIPDGVTSILGRAFRACSSLTNVTIPDSVTRIGDRAFAGCISLTNVTIPDSVTEIGYDVFEGCSSLKRIYGKPGSKAEQLAAELGVEFVSTGDESAATPRPTAAPISQQGRPAGLEVNRAGLCELDENNDWVRGRGNSAKLSDLSSGHKYGYYIEFENKSKKTISFQYELYCNGTYFSSYDITVKPNYTYTVWTWDSAGSTTGSKDCEWFVGGTSVLKKTLTISR